MEHSRQARRAVDDPEGGEPSGRPVGAGAPPAHERVYRALRADILEGRMAPGTSLTLRGIADTLGVSVTPAREAVRRLAAERALEMTGTGRVAVADPSPARLDELLAARRLLEPELARRALPGIDAGRLARLHALDAAIDALQQTGAPGAYVAANTRFHATLYAAAEAPALTALVESVWLQIAPAMHRIHARIGDTALEDHHRAALAAIAAGDAEALARAIAADLDQGASLVRRRTT